MKKIVVIEPGYLNYSAEESILQNWDPQFVVVPANASLEEKLRQVSNADAIMVREATVSRPMIEAMQQCRVIVRYGVGVDNIDSQAAREKGIYVANVPDYGSEDVAEHALALLLAATRRIATRNRDVRDGQWGHWPARTHVPPGRKNSRRRRLWPNLPLLCAKSIRDRF